jgi:short subunit fatty acids transporter
MEIVNLLVILVSCLVTWVWAIKKRFEIKTMEIKFFNDDKNEDYDEYERKVLERQKLIFEDSKDLEYTAQTLQDVTLRILGRIKKFSIISILIACLFIYLFFEDKKGDIA